MKYKIILYTLIAILLFTLPFKFGILHGPESGAFPFVVPLSIGIIELVSAVLLSFKKYRKYGALLALAIFSGAILAHVVILGIWYGKVLFPLAIVGLLSSIYIFKQGEHQI
jgi:hypothetical protein